jgi:ribosomal protein L7/L12
VTITLDTEQVYCLLRALHHPRAQKIEVIKELRDITGLGLKDALALVEAYQRPAGRKHRDLVCLEIERVA